MNSPANNNLDSAVSDIQAVSEQLEKLRGGIEHYATASNKLIHLSESLENLSNSLQQLPNSLAEVTKNGELLVSNIQLSLGPAGSLLVDIKNICKMIEDFPTRELVLNAFTELNISTASSHATTQGTISQVLHNSNLVSENLIDIKSAIESNETNLKKIHEILEITNKRLDEIVKADKANNDEIKERLVILDKLSRRSLFAILFGRDKID